MTERMTSVEIEDVLSSIRRLVTQDLRPRPPVNDEKLLLTPALRVVPTAATTGAEADEAPYAEAHEPADADAGDDDDEATKAGQSDMRDEMRDHVADELGPVFFHRATAHDLAGAVTSIGAEVPSDGYEPEAGEMGPADAIAVPDWPDSSWVAPEMISDVDEAEVVGKANGTLQFAQAAHSEEPAFAEAAEEAGFVDEDDAGALDQPALDASDVDPRGDIAEAAALAALADGDGRVTDPGLTDIDEEMLRDIVRDIIREELQGSLGERITRNVRKLVRAEINRAIAAGELE